MKNKDQIRHIITVVVRPKRIPDYENWLEKVRKQIIQFEGFVSMDIIRDKNASGAEYLIINRFETNELYEKWQSSDVLKGLLEEAKDFMVYRKVGIQRIGLDLYFDKLQSSDLYKRPNLWKKIIVGIIAVYPVIVFANITFLPYISDWDLPMWLSILISTCIVSPIIGWFLPLVTKVFNKWLYD